MSEDYSTSSEELSTDDSYSSNLEDTERLSLSTTDNENLNEATISNHEISNPNDEFDVSPSCSSYSTPLSLSPISDRMREKNHLIYDILNKEKPKYRWNSTYELMRREHGLAGSMRNFCTSYYASRQVVERMKVSESLSRHTKPVNSLNFNRAGDLLCSGSHDRQIIVWNWARSRPVHTFQSVQTGHILQTKFIDSNGCLDIIAASSDGEIRRSIIMSSGGEPQSMCLYRHERAVRKLVVCPQSTYEIISVGDDGYIRQLDIRSDANSTNIYTGSAYLFSISHHPFSPEICVSGLDKFVRVYDKRNWDKCVHEWCPEYLYGTTGRFCIVNSVYSNTGNEILASYTGSTIYLFNNKIYKNGEFLQRYRGHYHEFGNIDLSFFGPNSEYVVSGSDYGDLFFWDRNTECILNFVCSNTINEVRCIEPHKSFPVLATGFDEHIKIWTPHGYTYPPNLSKLPNYVKFSVSFNEMDGRDHQFCLQQFLEVNRDDDNSN